MVVKGAVTSAAPVGFRALAGFLCGLGALPGSASEVCEPAAQSHLRRTLRRRRTRARALPRLHFDPAAQPIESGSWAVIDDTASGLDWKVLQSAWSGVNWTRADAAASKHNKAIRSFT